MGRSRGGLTTNIHALVDGEGQPVRLELTAGQAGDAPMAEKLLSDLQPGSTLLADRAYDTGDIRNFAKDRKQTCSFSRWVYRQRNLVEQFFNRIKQMRDWQPDMIDVQTTTLPHSNWPPSELDRFR